jgi:hypothetical protein
VALTSAAAVVDTAAAVDTGKSTNAIEPPGQPEKAAQFASSLVSGYDFSRAATATNKPGLQPLQNRESSNDVAGGRCRSPGCIPRPSAASGGTQLLQPGAEALGTGTPMNPEPLQGRHSPSRYRSSSALESKPALRTLMELRAGAIGANPTPRFANRYVPTAAVRCDA